MQKYKRRKGSKRWTHVPIIKTMGTRCSLPCKKIKIAHVFPKKVSIESYSQRNIN